MPRRYKYTLLLSSLPRHPRRLCSDKTSLLSRNQLDSRLQLLDGSDAVELQQIETLVHGSQFNEENDETIWSNYRGMVDLISDEEIRQLARWHLELRMLLSALRLRQGGANVPGKNQFQEYGVWQDVIEKNWRTNDFGLSYRLPWLADAQALLANDQPYELEKFLSELIWRHYAEVGSRHYFDFSAVVIYVLRWGLRWRWSSYRADEAVKCFDKLAETGLDACDLSLGAL